MKSYLTGNPEIRLALNEDLSIGRNAVPVNFGSIDGSSHRQGSKAASLSCVGSQPPWTSLSMSAGGSAFGSSRPSCRPWETGDLLRLLATFNPLKWLGKPQIISSLACAQKGWMNIGGDKIAYESCGECLSFTSSSSWTAMEGVISGALMYIRDDFKAVDRETWLQFTTTNLTINLHEKTTAIPSNSSICINWWLTG